MNNQPVPIQQQPVTINLNNIKSEICEAPQDRQTFDQGGICTSTKFTKSFEYKRLSKLVSPTGKEEIICVEYVNCLACGAVKVFNQK